MKTGKANVAELIPVTDRVRWILLCRVVMVALLPVMWRLDESVRVSLLDVMLPAGAWLAITTPTLFSARRSRSFAVWSLNLALLGDGLLLCYEWWQLGALAGPVGPLVIVHAVAVTLLASFRTGGKLAVWHSLLALVVLETSAAGFLGVPVPVPLTSLVIYLVGMWITVLTTAIFATVNERELRRRRHDSEALRQFGLELSREQDNTRIARLLATFIRDELLASQTAVVVYPGGYAGTGDGGDATASLGGDGFVVVVDQAGTSVRTRAPAAPADGFTLRRAVGRGVPLLLRKLDPAADPWLAELLPAARNLIVVPFRLDEVAGATVVVHPRWSSQRSSQRVEHRMIETAQQAVTHASTAMSRVVLTDRIRAMADTDGLTGLANRRVFDATLREAITSAAETGGTCAVVMVDLDHFKRLNDSHGHLVGDEVLRTTAAAVRGSCREGDVPARYGGEEFAVVLPHADRESAAAAGARLHHAIGSASTSVPVSASVGVAVFPADGGDPTEVLRAADAALYAAKRDGRDRVAMADRQPVAA